MSLKLVWDVPYHQEIKLGYRMRNWEDEGECQHNEKEDGMMGTWDEGERVRVYALVYL